MSMLSEYQVAVGKLKGVGWHVKLKPPHQTLPKEIKNRYHWIPVELEQFLMEADTIASPDEKAWLLGMPDFLGISSSAFSWDEWERQSLEAANGDRELVANIKAFWDGNFPVAMSVKSGYAYFALRRSDLAIVCGEEPEFEEAVFVVATFLELLRLFTCPDSRFARWV